MNCTICGAREHDPCDICGAIVHVGEFPFCPHGRAALSVVGDDIPGGMVIENLGPTPRTFYSQRAILEAAKAQGLVNRVRHVDGDRHVARWV